jgi:sialate O-acetylesterase
MNRLIGFLAVALLAAVALPVTAAPKLELAALFSDHMVLQQGRPIRIFGRAAPGESVTVKLATESATAKADAEGRFTVQLASLKAGGPHVLEVTASETIRRSDVMIGEVWIASGQSNMEMSLKGARGAEAELATADQPMIRLFSIDKAVASKPLDDVTGAWKVASAESAKDFSAVAWYFARRIQKERNVAVGVIGNAWGGTSAEVWTPIDAMKGDPALSSIADEYMKLPEAERAKWTNGFAFDVEVKGLRLVPRKGGAPKAIAFAPKPGAYGGAWTNWAKPGSTSHFDAQGEVAHFRGALQPAAWGGCATPLDAGRPVDLRAYEALELEVRGSGKLTVSFGQPTVDDYDDFASQPLSPTSEWQTVRVPFDSLKQGGWGKPRPFTQDAITKVQLNVIVPYVPEIPGGAYNALVAPLTRYPIAGVIFYQGESNAGRAAQYQKLLPRLIGSWRKAYNQGDFPFLIVQLASFMQRRAQPSESNWAELREAQAMALSLPHTGLAVTIDVGDAKDIHPKDKRTVGERLAAWALFDPYGGKATHSGPLYESMKVEGDKIRVTFTNVGKGLTRRGDELHGFAIAGADKKFVWAHAKIEGKSVVVYSGDIKAPVHVRYGWADNPLCTLYNEEGFPASPFRTDR